MLFESPRPVLTAGVLALSAFLVSLAAQNSNLRRASNVITGPNFHAGVDARADLTVPCQRVRRCGHHCHCPAS
jgi:hypothetical protein